MKAFGQVFPVKTLLWVVPCVLLFLFAYWSSIEIILEGWNGVESAGNNHGWLVFGCTLYVLWLRKDVLLSLPLAPSAWALFFLAGTALLWFLSQVTQVQAGHMGVLPVLILLGIGALCSPRHLLAALLPIVLLFFALPVWQPLLPLLQDITTYVTHFCLKLIGRPVYVVDNFVHVTGGSFVIEEACSGLRFLLVSTTLSLMNSALNKHTWRQGIFMLGVAILLSFIANWIRVVFVIMLGDYTQMQHPWVSNHANLGWWMYFVLVLIPFFIISRYVEPGAEADEVPAPEQHHDDAELAPRKRMVQVLAAVVLFMTPLSFIWLGDVSSGNVAIPSLPDRIGEWNAVAGNSNSAWTPAFLNASTTLVQSYQRNGEVVNLHLVYYQNQQQGVELVNVNNRIADGSMWQVEPASESIMSPGGSTSIRAATVAGKMKRERVWYWYDVSGYETSNDYVAKIYQILGFLQGRSDAALVAASTSCSGDCKSSDALLGEFFSAMSAGPAVTLTSR